MDTTIIQHTINLFEIVCVIIVFAFLFVKSRFFTEVYDQNPAWTTRVLLMVFFGILSIFGTLSWVSIDGAVMNVRDLGPMAAGLICGPYVGIGAGIIGGLFRFAQGGPYIWTGLSAPILTGLLGGIMYLANRRRFIPTGLAVLFIGLTETLVSCCTLILVTKPSDFFVVVTTVAIPMILFNIIGMFIFATIVHQTLAEQKRRKEMQALELEVESRKNLNSIIDTMTNPVYVLDREHRYVLVNDSYCRFMGLSRGEILGKTHRAFFNEADAEFHWKITEEVFTTRIDQENEAAITKPDGQRSTLIFTIGQYRDSTGQEFVVGVIHDITERQKMQAALAVSEEWYRTLFEHTGTATIIAGEDSRIDQANSECEVLTGYTRDEMVGKILWDDIIHPDDLETVKRYHDRRRIDPTSVPSHYTVRIRARSGEVKTLHAVASVIPGTKKTIVSYIDVTERKKFEDALRLANRKLNLLSSMTRHDIINQIMILKGFLTLLSMKTKDPVMLDHISQGRKATDNIEHQIIFTRDYQDMGVKAPAWQDAMNSIIMAKGALTLGPVTVETERLALEVFADPLFERVFYNLIDNSLRYGGGNLHKILIRSEKTGTGLAITYEDDGAGISPGDKAHLFERGFGKHSGFGLFLSREILSITGISIAETGTPGSGARFVIQVPKGMYRFRTDGSPGAR
jgi:PAS domain S-box-containing protein